MSRAAQVTETLGGRQTGPNQWEAKCPYHDDQRPSLSLSNGESGSVLAFCHAGCDDVFRRLAEDDYLPRDWPAPRDQTLEAEYAYCDERGNVVFWILRMPGKRFIAQQPDGRGGRTSKMPESSLWVPYRLPQILGALPEDLVFITEGEKDADRLTDLGFIATTNPFGAGKWKPQYNRHFAGRDVVVVPDNDEAGRTHAAQVVAALRPVARSVRTLDLNACVANKGDVSDLIADGGVEAFNALVGALPPAQVRKPAFFSLADLSALPRTRALVEGLIPHGGFALLYSAAGAGKTFVAIDIAIAVSAGRPALGQRTESGLVMYCPLEGWSGFGARIQAALAERSLTEPIPFFFRNEPLNLLDRDSVGALISAVHEASELQQQPAALVVIDTLARAMPGADENSPGDMGKAVGAIERIQRETGAAVLVLHHSGKSREKGARGHSALRAAADAEILIDSQKGQRRLSVTKQRDDSDNLRVPFDLVEVEVASDESEAPRRSMVVRTTGAGTSVEVEAARLSLGAQRVRNALRQALDEHGRCLASPVAESLGVPADARVVTKEELTRACEAAKLSATPEARRKAIKRGLEELGAEVGARGGYFWFTDAASGQRSRSIRTQRTERTEPAEASVTP